MAEDLTILVLKEIRDGVNQTNLRLDRLESSLGKRIDKLGERVDRLDHSFNTRFEKVEFRLERVERGLEDLGRFMRQIAVELTEYSLFHKHHIELVEKDIVELKERMARTETWIEEWGKEAK